MNGHRWKLIELVASVLTPLIPKELQTLAVDYLLGREIRFAAYRPETSDLKISNRFFVSTVQEFPVVSEWNAAVGTLTLGECAPEWQVNYVNVTGGWIAAGIVCPGARQSDDWPNDFTPDQCLYANAKMCGVRLGEESQEKTHGTLPFVVNRRYRALTCYRNNRVLVSYYVPEIEQCRPYIAIRAPDAFATVSS